MNHKSWSGNTRLSHVIRFCGIITLGPTFQKKNFFVPGFLKGPLNLKKHEGSSHKETGRHRRYRSAGFRDCVRKESRRHRRGYQRKITKRLREEPLNWNPNPKLKTMLRKKQRTTYRRGQSRPSKAYVARIARSVVRRNEETKCFTQTLLNGTSSTNSWEFKSALAGLTQGTSTTTELVLELLLWQLSTLLRLLLLWLP